MFSYALVIALRLLSAREFGAEVVAGEWKTGANANAENKEIQVMIVDARARIYMGKLPVHTLKRE